MANLSFYKDKYGISSQEEAFDIFFNAIENYYDANYYVDWNKVFNTIRTHEAEFALLSTLCNKANKLQAAKELLTAYPQIIPVLPNLIGCRDTVTLVKDVELAQVARYQFSTNLPSHNIDEYADFLIGSGIVDLLEHIRNVHDYALGVEVGMDTNARKNRSGNCGINAVKPWIEKAQVEIAGLHCKAEADFGFLVEKGFPVPDHFRGIKWDRAFWLEGIYDKLVVMEVNHYGSSGSKPPAIAREYASRSTELKNSGIGFLWVTDGIGWRSMKNPLREAFHSIDYILNIKLIADGQLTDGLKRLLS